jgi:hypothetical protein
VNSLEKSGPFVYEGFTGAFASFLDTGDPNAHKLTKSSVPGLPDLGTGEEFVIGFDVFSNVKLGGLREKCSFWQRNGKYVPM